MFDFTVAIPTYNSANRLHHLLECLRSQANTEHFSWAIVVVDNNSTDNTIALVRSYQATWSAPFPLEYCFEGQQGAAFARQKAIEVSQSELIGCIDDDNLPESNWVANAYAFGKAYPQAGAYGGKIRGNFETPPPKNFEIIQSVLALIERGTEPNLYNPDLLDLPPGAAVVVRKSAWQASVPSCPLLGGRGNGSMMQGDDYEPLMYMHKAGWEIWYTPTLQTYHQIPKTRLERDYLISLSWGCGLCSCHLRMINANNWQKPLLIARILFGSDFRILVQHYLKYRQQLSTEIVPACQLAIFLANWLSPFYFLRDWTKSGMVYQMSRA